MQAIREMRNKLQAQDVYKRQHINEIQDDRAILRSIHFFEETSRVERAAEAIGKADYEEFLKLMDESGRSSWELLQNCYCMKEMCIRDSC